MNWNFEIQYRYVIKGIIVLEIRYIISMPFKRNSVVNGMENSIPREPNQNIKIKGIWIAGNITT